MDPAFIFLLEVFGISAPFGFVFGCVVYGKRVERSHSFKTGRFYGHAKEIDKQIRHMEQDKEKSYYLQDDMEFHASEKFKK